MTKKDLNPNQKLNKNCPEVYIENEADLISTCCWVWRLLERRNEGIWWQSGALKGPWQVRNAQKGVCMGSLADANVDPKVLTCLAVARVCTVKEISQSSGGERASSHSFIGIRKQCPVWTSFSFNLVVARPKLILCLCRTTGRCQD